MNCAWFTIVDSKFLLEKQHYDINHLRKRERERPDSDSYPELSRNIEPPQHFTDLE